MPTGNTRSAVVAVWSVAVVWAAGAGCSRYIDPNVPEPIRPHIEPQTGRAYELYRPSSYDRRQEWPLIVVCHSSAPDSPNRQIRDWTQLAEEFGFIVVAPRLEGTKRTFRADTDAQIRRQRADEEHILATIRHVRAGHNISDARIFIHGFSRGAFAALPVGLRHPEIFRAVTLTQPKFNSDYLADVGAVFDRHQPIQVHYSVSDVLTGKHARRCVDWLRANGADLREDPSGSRRRGESRATVAFLEDVIRRKPWIHIRAMPVGDADTLETRFKVRASHRPDRYLWRFGDGDESASAAPVHQYDAPGSYRVSLTVEDAQGRTHDRTVVVSVPSGRTRPAAPASGSNP